MNKQELIKEVTNAAKKIKEYIKDLKYDEFNIDKSKANESIRFTEMSLKELYKELNNVKEEKRFLTVKENLLKVCITNKRKQELDKR